ncbi:MAG: hypothetical protein RBQ94_06960 [Methanimicrococcus sp.]|nr:hypothetical protein [Methanimicrococcus sp.]
MNEKNLKTLRLFSKIAKIFVVLTILVGIFVFLGTFLEIINGIDFPPFVFNLYSFGLGLSLLILIFAAVIEYKEAKKK